MIKSFKHKGLKLFYETGNTRGIRPEHIIRLRSRLSVLDAASTLNFIGANNWNLHPLGGNKKKQYAINVSGNWRLFFEFDNGNIFSLNYDDYH